MGTWGYRAFENDLAADWVYDLEETGPEAVRQALAARPKEARLEADTAAIAFAAAEVVAAALGQQRVELPPGVRSWVDAHAAAVPRTAVKDALRAIRRIKSSELAELWKESEDHVAWRDTLADLERRLQAAAGET